MQYIYETHCHTDESSGCGRIPGEEVGRLYKEAGYSGIVITDHFNSHTYRASGCETWEQFVDYNMIGYLAAKKYEDENFIVMHGIEIRFENDNDNDYLVFGITREWLLAHPFIYDLDDYDDFYKLAHADGLVVFQAHPFRDNITVANPNYLDGIEVFNGNVRHQSRCEIALSWAYKYSLRILSGSDFHEIEDFARGGIVTSRKVNNMDDFKKLLLDNDYSIKYGYDFTPKSND